MNRINLSQQEEIAKLLQVEEAFNHWAIPKYNTKLQGGFAEPFYKTFHRDETGKLKSAEIQYRENFLRSALHEISHWCIAGNERRLMDDFGYWYTEENRDQKQQNEFYKVEIRPQAIEMGLCEALNIPFNISADNLNSNNLGEIDSFRQAVMLQYSEYKKNEFPHRAGEFIILLQNI